MIVTDSWTRPEKPCREVSGTMRARRGEFPPHTRSEKMREIFELAATHRIAGAADRARRDFSVSRLSQAGAFARRSANAGLFCGAWNAGIFFVYRGSD